MSAAGSDIRTTCPYCGVGCGVLARRDPNGSVRIEGDPAHPANRGRLCSKGSALGATVDLQDRLLQAQIEGRPAALDRALDHVAAGFQRIIAAHGPNSVALYVSGQLLTEDYYVANKLAKGYLGTANIDTNSRLCMSSSVAGHKRAFGEDVVPLCYEDFELADLVVLVGSNAAWCHPILFQRITEAKRVRPQLQLIVVDPRRSATSQLADLHLPVRAGTDVWLFNGLLSYLHADGQCADAFVERHTAGLATALQVAQGTAGDVESVALACGIEAALLADFYRRFAATERTITVFSQGVNQSSAGTDKVNSIINCHLFTGRIGRPGMGPFSVTGQPNAMGGREVGGLANVLAAHMDLDNEAHRRTVQRFWNSPTIADRPGLKAVDLFDAMHSGDIRAVWIMATNPVVSLPDADKVREALRRCELVVVSDCIEHTDTNAFAHVLLPAAAWGEKDGTVTNSERCISRQRAFLPLPGDAKPDWWLICQVARRLGHADAFSFASSHEVFAEHARLSATDNRGIRAFDIGGLALDRAGYDDLEPIRWPVTKPGDPGTARLLMDGRYYHADGKARFVATEPRTPAHPTDETWPYVLNTGRVRDQWHTMTRSGRAPQLTSHTPEPFVDMHAQDAMLCGLREGELARVETRWGSLVGRLRTSGELPRNMIFVPIHWSDTYARDARVGALVNPIVDPISGEPELKHTPARVVPFAVDWHGFILTRRALATLDVAWWSLARGAQFLRYEIAGRRDKPDADWARALLAVERDDADWLEYSDVAAGVYRAAVLTHDRLDACVFVSTRPDLPARTWLSTLFARERLSDGERAALLTGQPLDRTQDTGPIVCSCFGIGRKTICDAITRDRLGSPQAVGKKLRAGTNCGSCLAEIRSLIAACT